MTTPRLLMSPQDAVLALGLKNVRQVYHLIKTGVLPVVHLGRALAIDVKSLEAWIATASNSPTGRRPRSRSGQAGPRCLGASVDAGGIGQSGSL